MDDASKPRRFEPLQVRPAVQWSAADGQLRPIERVTPEEAPIGLTYDGRPYVVLMATPADVEELAIGFTLSEGLCTLADIEAVRVAEHPEGIEVDLTLTASGRQAKARMRNRTMEGRSSCGICGVQVMGSAVRDLTGSGAGPVVAHSAITTALQGLEAAQAYGQETRAMHAAAWCDMAGRVLLLREDVGRHNALDKLVGAAAKAGLDPATAMIVITSRCSYEMVEKTAAVGARVLVAISAPTALAIRKAEEAGLTLVALARPDGHAVFAGAQRIVG
jgi:FdhD protein